MIEGGYKTQLSLFSWLNLQVKRYPFTITAVSSMIAMGRNNCPAIFTSQMLARFVNLSMQNLQHFSMLLGFVLIAHAFPCFDKLIIQIAHFKVRGIKQKRRRLSFTTESRLLCGVNF